MDCLLMHNVAISRSKRHRHRSKAGTGKPCLQLSNWHCSSSASTQKEPHQTEIHVFLRAISGCLVLSVILENQGNKGELNTRRVITLRRPLSMKESAMLTQPIMRNCFSACFT